MPSITKFPNVVDINTLRTIVVFRNSCDLYYTPEVLENLYPAMEKMNLGLRCCDNWDELGEVLKSKTESHIIAPHINMINCNGITVHEFVAMIETLVKLTTTKKMHMMIIVEKDTPNNVVKELQKTNILGIIPNCIDFGFDEAIRAVEAGINHIPYWPKHIIDNLPGSKKTVTKNTIKLTVRQAQIVNLIAERGLTNKKIAQALNITESTVKIHVSAILKAYGVRTRTQLALAAIK